MKRLTAFAALLVLFLSIQPVGGLAQEVEATVSVNDDQLSPSAQQELAGFAEEMQRYINTIRWTDSEWEGEKVKMNFNVAFSGGSSSGYYTARLLVGSQRSVYKSNNFSPMMKVFDDAWTFRYVRNQPFQQDLSRYDELTGLIDFYVYIAIGLDLDSYAYLGGTSMYERARLIAQRAQIRNEADGWTTQATPGSYSRYNFISELTNLRFNPLRQYIFDYHYNGLDLLAEHRRAALDSINNHLTFLVKTIDRLVQPTTIVRVLNDAKNVEYGELFADETDELVWKKLLYIDPVHQSVYEAARKK